MPTTVAARIGSGISEFDRVLGGGIVPGSLVLLGGAPGIGKSTLLLQAAAHFAATVGPVLYCSGEESEHQVKGRGERLGVGQAPLYLLAETCTERILDEVQRLQPALLIVDSIQTVYSTKLTSAPGTVALDLCCGTGDLLLALESAGGGATVMGSDFCHPMLRSAAGKIARRGLACGLFEADALEIPARDGSFDLITVAFGFRNLANYRKGLEEMRRLLRPGGVAAILEFSQPPNPVFAALYNFYSRRILPAISSRASSKACSASAYCVAATPSAWLRCARLCSTCSCVARQSATAPWNAVAAWPVHDDCSPVSCARSEATSVAALASAPHPSGSKPSRFVKRQCSSCVVGSGRAW